MTIIVYVLIDGKMFLLVREHVMCQRISLERGIIRVQGSKCEDKLSTLDMKEQIKQYINDEKYT